MKLAPFQMRLASVCNEISGKAAQGPLCKQQAQEFLDSHPNLPPAPSQPFSLLITIHTTSHPLGKREGHRQRGPGKGRPTGEGRPCGVRTVYPQLSSWSSPPLPSKSQ